ncbi:MAG: hypothetical protein KCHDKBKB_03089 [Elusimicrobia bacterium]|nr:hypothetical protein [Elusimicrobiota bacterium]
MLKALEEQLKTLSLDPKDPFTKQVRQIVGPRRAPQIEMPIRKMVLSMPAMIRQIRLWVDDTDQSWHVKRLQFFGLAYLYNPTDFLSEKAHGFFGYVDDAYILARIYERTKEEVPLAGLGTPGEDAKLSEEVGDWIKTTQELLPEETRRIDEVLDQYAHGKKGRHAFVYGSEF